MVTKVQMGINGEFIEPNEDGQFVETREDFESKPQGAPAQINPHKMSLKLQSGQSAADDEAARQAAIRVEGLKNDLDVLQARLDAGDTLPASVSRRLTHEANDFRLAYVRAGGDIHDETARAYLDAITSIQRQANSRR